MPGDIACVISRGSGNYGCSGPIPAAPNGANVVTGAQVGPAGFTNADRPLYVFETLPKRLEPGTKISFRNVTCGTDGTVTAVHQQLRRRRLRHQPGGQLCRRPEQSLDRPAAAGQPVRQLTGR